MKTISFEASKQDRAIIHLIAQRANRTAIAYDIDYCVGDAMMDITACHANGMPLRLKELSSADDFNFCHDVFGIRRHIDRETGELNDCFVPRYSQPQ